MATRFEVVLPGPPTPALQAAAEEALRAVTDIEKLLSPYVPTSDVWRINHHAWKAPVRVSPLTAGYLLQILELNRVTEGAFDINVGRLMQNYGFRDNEAERDSLFGAVQPYRSLDHALVVDLVNYSVKLAGPEVYLDVGAIGKGIALDCAAEVLRGCGVECGFIHGGSSSAIGIGSPQDEIGWKVEVAGPDGDGDNMAEAWLCNGALSVSTRSGRTVERDDAQISHVMDPRTGQPATSAEVAAVITTSAAVCDAATTALLVLGTTGMATIRKACDDVSALVVTNDGGARAVHSEGHAFALLSPYTAR
jgi:thiamine biosynthesis lipoprotein